MSGQSGGYRLRLATLNEQLTCKLCGGYFIDATTIIECLHSFCRSCIIKYLESNKYCPICEVQVHKSKPLLNIRPDHTLQDIVYKLVPGCYQNEMRCRREFYSKYPDAQSQANSPESRGEPIESHIYSLDESLSLSLEYYIPNSKEQTDGEKESTATKLVPRRYLRCPAAVTVFHLQKLIRAKYGLSDAHRVDIMYKEEPLCGSYTLMDVMYIYHWRRKVPLHLSYRIFESSPKRLKLSEDNQVYEQILSNTKVDLLELKSDQSEKREWKEVQLKISETGVMSVTGISTFEKKNFSNGEGDSEGLIKIDNSRVEKIDKIEKTEKRDKNDDTAAQFIAKEDCNKSCAQTIQSAPAPNLDTVRISRNILLDKETIKASATTEENANAPRPESRKVYPSPSPVPESSKAVHHKKSDTRSENESDSLASYSAKVSSQSKVKNNLGQDPSEAKPGQESPSVKKPESRIVNTNNNFINTEGKTDSQKENSKCGGKDLKNASTSVESKQNVLGAMLPFQPKVGQVSNTYAKKIPKEKKTVLANSRKLDSKSILNQSKSDAKPTSHFANTKSQVTATVSLAKLPTSLVSSTHLTTMSTQTVNTFVSVPQTSSLVSAPQVTTCIVSNSTMVSAGQNSPSTTKTGLPSPQHLDCQVLKSADQKSNNTTAVKSDSISQKLPLARNNNNIPTSTSPSLASIGLNVSTAMPLPMETSSGVSHTVQSFMSTPQVKNAEFKIENSPKINGPIERQGASATTASLDSHIEAQTNIYSTATATVGGSRLAASPQTPNTTKRTKSQCGLEISSVYTVPPCPDAIPISLMKPTVRKNEIIAKGTNLNEICAKIGESSKEKIKAATRSKPDVPNLLKISKKNAVDTTKTIPNVPHVSVYTSGNNANLREDKSNVCLNKDGTKISSSVTTTSQSVPISLPSQRPCPVKKQSQSVGYKTLRDPPKSWNPTLSKNNYVAARNQAKEIQNQTQGSSVSDGNGTKPIVSKPAKIFKMRNMPRYLGNPASGVKPMYGVSNDKDKDQVTQNTQKSSSLNMMTIDPKTLSPIVSTANSPIISPPPYSPNARTYQNTQFSREICRNPGSPVSPRNSPINMLSTNPFIPSPTLNTNPRLIYTHFLPPFPDTSRFPNPLIRSPIGIPSSAFHSSLPPPVNKYQRSSYLPPQTSYSTTPPPPPTVQKILPSMHSSPKSPKSTVINTSPMFSMGKPESHQLPTRVENIALTLAKNAAQQELNIFNLSKTGIPVVSNFQNLLTTNTVTPSTMGYTSAETSQNIAAQASEKAKPQLEIKVHEMDAHKQKIVEPETVDLDSMDEPSTLKLNCSESVAESKNLTDCEKKEKIMAKINGDIATQNKSSLEKISTEPLPKITETSSVSTNKEVTSKEVEKAEKSLEINTGKGSHEAKSEDALRKTAEQIQGRKSDVQRNKPES